jgi:hypothetical protein
MKMSDSHGLREAQGSVYVSLNITEKKYDPGDKAGKPTSETIIIDQFFIPFFTAGSFSDVIDEEDLEKDPTGASTIGSATRDVEFTMYSVKGLNANKTQVNAILGSREKRTDVGTAMGWILNQAKTKDEKLMFQNVIVDEPLSKIKYPNIIIPPNNFAMSFHELQTRYGIYDGGLIVFYDEPVLYILNKYVEAHEYIEESTYKITFNLRRSVNNPATPTQIQQRKSGDQVYELSNIPKKTDQSIYQAELYGEHLIFSNFNMGAKMLEYTEDEVTVYNEPRSMIATPTIKHEKTGMKIMTDYDELNNVLNMTSFAKAIGPHTIYDIDPVDFVDFNSFRPNTIINFSFADNDVKNLEYGGAYTILECGLSFRLATEGKNSYICRLEKLTVIK